jgi:hypothetical protein
MQTSRSRKAGRLLYLIMLKLFTPFMDHLLETDTCKQTIKPVYWLHRMDFFAGFRRSSAG